MSKIGIIQLCSRADKGMVIQPPYPNTYTGVDALKSGQSVIGRQSKHMIFGESTNSHQQTFTKISTNDRLAGFQRVDPCTVNSV